jgi:hypothetical protein
MKLVKGLGLLSFLVIVTGSCFDPPEFPVEPKIEFERVEFIDSQDPSEFDSLNLYINFKDGDLGFNNTPQDISDPYHSAFFYQENNGKIEPLSTTPMIDRSNNEQYDLLLIPDPAKGKIVTFRTRQKPEYSFLPPGDICAGSNSLKYYEYLNDRVDPENESDGRRMLIEANDLAALDPLVQLVDSFPRTKPEYYQIRDTLYYTTNPNHYNIEVDFLVKDLSAPGGFTEFDWREEYCTTFDGRFPVFSDKRSSIDGILRYSMTSLGFKSVFSIKTLKLRVSIRDRAGHTSNVIETSEFTLH